MVGATVYYRLGVRPVLNAAGNLTVFGGSVMPPEVLTAMGEAASTCVDLEALLTAAGRRVAELAGVEAAHVTSGAAAGLALAVAACITGLDEDAAARLPDTTGLGSTILVQAPQTNEWLRVIALAGGTIVTVGSRQRTMLRDFEGVISGAAAIVDFPAHSDTRSVSLRDLIPWARDRSVPVIVDAAAELPPVGNLRHYTDLGADLVLFSGGKMLRGPACTGIILGRGQLIAACARHSSPNIGIGRPFKVGKEEIAGLVRAVELFVENDFGAEMAGWSAMVDGWVERLRHLPGVTVSRVDRGEDDVRPELVPRVYVTWSAELAGFTPTDLANRLRHGDPSVAVGVIEHGISVNPSALRPADAPLVGGALADTISFLLGGVR